MNQNPPTKTIMKKQIFISILTGLAFSLVCAGHVFAEEKPVGKIISIVGMAEFKAPSNQDSVAQSGEGKVKPVSFTPWTKVKPYQLVYTKDVFRTSKKSRIKILFDDKSLIALGPNSQMKVESYIYKPEEKLRQGVISVAHGLSMYIVNKGQSNKKSSFRIVTPTANIAARGTQGYTSVSSTQTIVANQSSAVEVSNIDFNVKGVELVEAMMKSIIETGKSPTEPVPFTDAELTQIRSAVNAWVNSSYGTDDLEEFFEEFNDANTESCEG